VTRALAFMALAGALMQAQPPRDARPVAAPRGTASIEGVVLSDEAQPKKLRRARVSLAGAGAEDGITVITDDEGRFRFDALPAGPYSLGASKDGYVARSAVTSRLRPGEMAPVAIPLRDGEAKTVTLRLPRGAVITGVVTDAEGQPAPGVIVGAMEDRFDASTGTRRLRMTANGVTDDRGIYRIFGLRAGRYVVYVQTSFGPEGPEVRRGSSDARPAMAPPIYYPATADGDRATRITLAAGEERTGVDVQTQYLPTASIQGFVAGGAAGTVAPVMLLKTNDPLAATIFLRSAGVAPDGQFVFSGVPPGR